ncbi:LOW QUALITY PROTEIN: hypothetical protein TorRG33x02_301730, partial [Trema orientale]
MDVRHQGISYTGGRIHPAPPPTTLPTPSIQAFEISQNSLNGSLLSHIYDNSSALHILKLAVNHFSDRALDAEQAEKDVLDEERIRRERQAREMQRGFKLGFQGNRGGQIQIQRSQDIKRKGTPTQQTRPDQ